MWETILLYKNYFFIALGLLIPLLGYAVFLQWGQLKDIIKGKEDEKIAAKKRYDDRQADLRESLRIISLATVQGQCEISEASLRVANLLPLYDDIDHKQHEFKAIFDLYEDIKKLNYKEARNELNINERFAEDKIRFAAEDKHKDEVIKVCERIYEQTRA